MRNRAVRAMDYDLTNIPAGYDRGRDHGPEVLALWMNAVAAHLEGHTVRTILDLGCGTGRFSEGLGRRFDASVIGIDPSTRMLDRARDKRRDHRVEYVKGRAEAIPLPSGSVDVIFISMVFHHFQDPPLSARECRRVLRDDGAVFVRTGTRGRISSYPYVPFFPSTAAMLENLLPDEMTLRDVFERAGLRMDAAETITQIIAPDWAAYAEKLSAGGDSVIARLDSSELEDGLVAMRTHAVAVPGQSVAEPIDLFAFRPPGRRWSRSIEIAPERLTSPVVAALIGALNAELSERYPEPGANHFRLDPDEVARGAGVFLVARANGVAVGCGAVRRVRDPILIEGLGPRVGEIKRMYVAPHARGGGIGRALLARLEREARALGLDRLVLETGTRQEEAIALYRRAGFADIPPFGEYLASAATSVCMAKALGPVE